MAAVTILPPSRRGAVAAPLLLLALAWPGPDARGAEAGAAGGPPRLGEGPHYERCLEMLQRDPDGARRMADAWLLADGGEAARHCAALALLALGEAQRAADRLEDLATRSTAAPAARAGVFAQAGQAWMMADQPDRAFAAATMGLTIAPDDVELLLDRAIALGMLGRYAEATEDLDRVLALDPQRAAAWVLRAAAQRNLGAFAQAERDVAHALALAPGNAEALLERGTLRRLGGDVQGARSDWERAIALAPGSPAAEAAARHLGLGGAGPPPR